MPYKQIEYSQISQSTSNESPIIFTTELGNTILEIQGDLILPEFEPSILDDDPEIANKYLKISNRTFIKIGKLEIDEISKKATLYIGTSQRLLGDIKSINPPLALLKFPNDKGETDQNIKLIDVIKNKIIFSGRPLPIM
ncbi:hypothetical protein WICMUC_001236 [Wickerhamomyces mucosus]|uniref:Chromosome transmission fidelity protein 8 n=1 Tax=Wickerhamomyces mucosus TaxID=1378264 RepID=A0A9P8THZ0_9ASCO|nr:hypothetical protein WICMUC_001236 [Wickerhamomyces mucosus]